MLWVSRNERGELVAACEWHRVDAAGRLCPDGAYLWIEQFELSAGSDAPRAIRHLIAHLASQRPQAVGAYWTRWERTGHRQHAFWRSTLMRYAERAQGVSHGIA